METSHTNAIITVRDDRISVQPRRLWTNSNTETIRLAEFIQKSSDDTLQKLDEPTRTIIQSQLRSAASQNPTPTASKNPITQLVNSVRDFVFKKLGLILDEKQIDLILKAEKRHEQFVKKIIKQTTLDVASDLQIFAFDKAGFAQRSPFKGEGTWNLPTFLDNQLTWMQKSIPSAQLSLERHLTGMGCVVKLTCKKNEEQQLLKFLQKNSASWIKPSNLTRTEAQTEEGSQVSYTLGQTDTMRFFGQNQSATDHHARLVETAENFIKAKKWDTSPFKTGANKFEASVKDTKTLSENFTKLGITPPQAMKIENGRLVCTFKDKVAGDAFVAALRRVTAGCVALPFFENIGDDVLKKNTWNQEGTEISIRRGYTELLICGEYLNG